MPHMIRKRQKINKEQACCPGSDAKALGKLSRCPTCAELLPVQGGKILKHVRAQKQPNEG